MFETIGEGHKIMAEGPKKEIDLDALERLAAQATPGPWRVADKGYLYVTDANPNREIARLLMKPRAYNANATYIVASCNAVPELVAENRALREKVKMMDWQMAWLAKQVCDSFSPQEWINRAEKAAKEAGE